MVYCGISSLRFREKKILMCEFEEGVRVGTRIGVVRFGEKIGISVMITLAYARPSPLLHHI